MIHACMPPLSSEIIARAKQLSCSLLLDGKRLSASLCPAAAVCRTISVQSICIT